MTIIAEKNSGLDIVTSYLSGGLGPGSFFTPVFIQHLLIFPLIMWAVCKLDRYDQFIAIIIFFCISLFAEWICLALHMPEWLYRLVYVRYIFAVVIGIYLVRKAPTSMIAIWAALILSVSYIVVAS
ncbi:MAG: hypothetical protein PHY31_05465 [Smithellaceae bacterium]|nr:hypothetical protein [Smithellaceae bacterium]